MSVLVQTRDREKWVLRIRVERDSLVEGTEMGSQGPLFGVSWNLPFQVNLPPCLAVLCDQSQGKLLLGLRLSLCSCPSFNPELLGSQSQSNGPVKGPSTLHPLPKAASSLHLNWSCLVFASHTCSAGFPALQLGGCSRAGFPQPQLTVARKEGGDAAGAKRNINLTFSKRVNPFTALQQWGACSLSCLLFSYHLSFSVVWPAGSVDSFNQHGNEGKVPSQFRVSVSLFSSSLSTPHHPPAPFFFILFLLPFHPPLSFLLCFLLFLSVCLTCTHTSAVLIVH